MPEKLEISPTGEHTTLDSDWYPEPSSETEQQVAGGAVVPEGSQDEEGLHTRTRSNIWQGIVWTLMARFRCRVRNGSVREGAVLVAFPPPKVGVTQT